MKFYFQEMVLHLMYFETKNNQKNQSIIKGQMIQLKQTLNLNRVYEFFFFEIHSK